MPDTNDYTYDMNDSTEDFAKSFRKDFITDLESPVYDYVDFLEKKLSDLSKVANNLPEIEDYEEEDPLDGGIKDYGSE